jgi:hypothetical protein
MVAGSLAGFIAILAAVLVIIVVRRRKRQPMSRTTVRPPLPPFMGGATLQDVEPGVYLSYLRVVVCVFALPLFPVFKNKISSHTQPCAFRVINICSISIFNFFFFSYYYLFGPHDNRFHFVFSAQTFIRPYHHIPLKEHGMPIQNPPRNAARDTSTSRRTWN